MNDKLKIERQRKALDRNSAIQLGQERMAQPKRHCPVEGCPDEPRTFSRYCAYHAARNKRLGHPVVNTATRTRKDYANCLKLGRWLREQLCENEMDRRSWMRTEEALERMGRDHRLKYDIPTIARREGTWRNSFKAQCLLSRRLEAMSAEEIIAAYLGMVVLILSENTVPVSAVQMEYFFNKSGGRTAVRYKRIQAVDPETGKLYKWKPTDGTLTCVGKVIHGFIQHEQGKRWWKHAEVVIATKLNRA